MIIFAVRHADRKDEPADELTTPEGLARAELLGRMLAESGVSVAYCSTARRAQQTLNPLKGRLGAKLAVTAVDKESDQHVKTIVEGIGSLSADKVVVVVSHSDTTELIVEELTKIPVDSIGSHEFDKLFVVFIDPSGSATYLQLRYGAPT